VKASDQAISGERREILTPLTSIRFFAALHILFFHLGAAHAWQRETELPPLMPMYNRLPAWLENWGLHAHCSTGLFFLISGFILAYLYVRPDGTLSTNRRRFWIARLTRIYPLHLVALVLLIPVAIRATETIIETGMSGLLSALLLQAWIPRYALSWNYPTWALSVMACFYVCFPWMVRIMRGRSRRSLACWLMAMPLVSLAPTVIFLALGGSEEIRLSRNAGAAWMLVNYLPLLWLPHFAMGMLLARVCGMSRYDTTWREERRNRAWSLGDTAFAAVVAITVLDQVVPVMVLRHGALAPLYLVTIRDLAHGRGMLSRVLCLPGMRAMGDASFAVFVLQYPAVSYLNVLRRFDIPEVVPMLPLIIVAIILGSVLSTRFFEKPVSKWLRARLLGE
jgi:peptidoglycan/LPS O-acetylase OafA/YrhL